MSAVGPVVIALDGSPHSARTLEWGLAEALLRGADVVLAHASPDPAETIIRVGWYPLLEDLHLDAEAQQYLRTVLRQARERAPALTVEGRLLSGSAVTSLRDLTARAQLLVAGARGFGDDRPLGSVSAHLAAHASCPVAVVRGPVAGADVRSPVVVGVDRAPCSLAAARVAAREAALRGVALTVVHALPVPLSPYAPGRAATPLLGPEPDVDATHEPAERLADSLRREHPGLPVTLDLRDGDPARALADAGRHGQLLVVGSRGLGTFRGRLLGSVSGEVARVADGTVLVVHAGRAASAVRDGGAPGSSAVA